MLKRSKQDLARLGESIAASYLVKGGYSIACKNFRVPKGEIDLIVEKNQQLIFVEVKTRSYHSMDSAVANVNHRKQVRISTVAFEYCKQNPHFDNHNTRFDVIIVFYDSRHDDFSVKHFIDAFLPVLED